MTTFSAESFAQKIISPQPDFEGLSQELWDYQRAHNPVIKTFCQNLDSTEKTWIPISFFKEFDLKTGADWTAEHIF